jgi:hypothetical protein
LEIINFNLKDFRGERNKKTVERLLVKTCYAHLTKRIFFVLSSIVLICILRKVEGFRSRITEGEYNLHAAYLAHDAIINYMKIENKCPRNFKVLNEYFRTNCPPIFGIDGIELTISDRVQINFELLSIHDQVIYKNYILVKGPVPTDSLKRMNVNIGEHILLFTCEEPKESRRAPGATQRRYL